VAVAAAAPARLLPRIDTISVQHGRGAVAELKNGPVVIFGRAVELDRKWAAATAVLAQRSSQGATYIDVRMPERPVAGGLDLQQDPQPQPEGATPGSPGIVPAVPPAGAVTPVQPGQAPATGTAPAPGSTAVTPAGTAAGGTAPATAATPSTGTATAGSTTSTGAQP
jgi:hypothetical protein